MACGLVDLDQQGTKMKIIFVRHGEPDYRELEERSYTGFGMDLAPYLRRDDNKLRNFAKIPYYNQLTY